MQCDCFTRVLSMYKTSGAREMCIWVRGGDSYLRVHDVGSTCTSTVNCPQSEAEISSLASCLSYNPISPQHACTAQLSLRHRYAQTSFTFKTLSKKHLFSSWLACWMRKDIGCVVEVLNKKHSPLSSHAAECFLLRRNETISTVRPEDSGCQPWRFFEYLRLWWDHKLKNTELLKSWMLPLKWYFNSAFSL